MAAIGLGSSAFGQNDGLLQGEQSARGILQASLTGTAGHNVVGQRMLLTDKKEAIRFAEQVLFDVYGKAEITRQKPYEAYDIDNHWVITGTLKDGGKGGTFLIVIDARDYRVVRLSHGK